MVPPRHPLSAGAVLLGVVTLVTAALTGCTLVPEPPQALVRQAAQVAADLRAKPGVASARSAVRAQSWRHPEAWIVAIDATIRSADDLRDATAEVAATVDAAPFRHATDVRLALEVPAGPGVAQVSLSESRLHRDQTGMAAAIDAADALRRLPVVDSVDLTGSTQSVRLDTATATSAAPLATAAAALRSIAGFGAGRLTSVMVEWPLRPDAAWSSIDISVDGPSDALAATVDELASRPDVERIALSEQRSQDRPQLALTTGHVDADTELLAATADPAAERLQRPRTAFWVHSSDLKRTATGFVGVPLGTATPDLHWNTVDNPPLPAEQVAATLADAEAALRSFLTKTVIGAGRTDVAQPVDTEVACNAAAALVQCTVLLPLWHEPDATEVGVEARYAAITAAWRRAGLMPSERALGTELWTPATDASAASGVALARLRGTVDGIRADVESPPVR